MRLLDRYLLRELLFPLSSCLGGMLLVVVTSDLFIEMGRFQKEKLKGLDIAHYYLLMTPGYLALILPIALLLALLYALTNHARHHELTAMRAAGISLWRLCLPYLGVGLLASVLVFLLNEVWVPDSAEAGEQIRSRYTRSHASGPHLPQGVFSNLPFTNARNRRQWHMSLYNSNTGEMQIDLNDDGVTPNDPGDTDTGEGACPILSL